MSHFDEEHDTIKQQQLLLQQHAVPVPFRMVLEDLQSDDFAIITSQLFKEQLDLPSAG